MQPQTFKPSSKNSAASDFINLWESKESDADAQTKLKAILNSCELTGRVSHGQADDPAFGKLLSADEWKRLSWVFGPDALPNFLGKSARGICLTLGCGEDWLDYKLRNGKLFKLCIFPSESVSGTKATWDGVQILLEKYYPEVWPKISCHYDDISRMTTGEIERMASYDMNQANLVGRDPLTGESTSEHYMSLQRLQHIESPSLVQVRQFLWDEIGLGKLFRGDGYTYDDDGNQGNLEYLAKQMPLMGIEGAAIVDIVPSRAEDDIGLTK